MPTQMYPPSSGGGGTQYAEDTASAAGEQITMAGVVRKDSPASLVDADGDRTELQVDAAGYLRTSGFVVLSDFIPTQTDDATTFVADEDYYLWGMGGGVTTAVFEFAGSWVATIVFEGHAAAGAWIPIQALNRETGALVSSTSANGVFVVTGTGLTEIRARVDAFTSGPVEIHTAAGYDPTLLRLTAPLPAGTNNIGDVDVASSALPTGAATETTLGTRLSESDFDTKAGSLTEAAPATDTASSGLNGRLQRIAQRLTSIIALLPTALGAGGGLKVDGSGTALPVSGTVTANAGSNLNTSSLALDATVGTTNTEIGATNETAPASDTATSGLNGRLQRIAQRITSLIALVPTSLGQKTMANSFAVTLASDQASVPVAATLQASTNTQEVVGDVAHDSPVGGNPLLNGFEARTTDGTAVSSGDVVRGAADTLGKEVVLLGAVHDLHVDGKGTFTNTTAADIIAAQGAGIRIVVTSVLVTNAHATVGTKVEIRDGTTVKLQGQAAAAGGGFALNAGGAPLMISTANTAVTARNVTTGADVDVFISGYTIKN